jgi:nicotinate-nucleotide adenylyltransferase
VRLGLFGGTFDPPHRGHIAVAQAAASEFGLDRVLIAPVGRQPLKAAATVASFADRLAMVRLACADDTRLSGSDLDAPHSDGAPNYTLDTLLQLKHQMPGAQLFAIAGVDSFRSLGRWREPRQLLTLAEWIVVSRPGFAVEATCEPEGMVLTSADRARIHWLGSVREDVSATELRRRLHLGEPCPDLLPKGVADYIAQHGLYR